MHKSSNEWRVIPFLPPVDEWILSSILLSLACLNFLYDLNCKPHEQKKNVTVYVHTHQQTTYFLLSVCVVIYVSHSSDFYFQWHWLMSERFLSSWCLSLSQRSSPSSSSVLCPRQTPLLPNYEKKEKIRPGGSQVSWLWWLHLYRNSAMTIRSWRGNCAFVYLSTTESNFNMCGEKSKLDFLLPMLHLYVLWVWVSEYGDEIKRDSHCSFWQAWSNSPEWLPYVQACDE